ncbi:hypothetical protein [Demequina sp.]|uniref:hypothetical protein n=1 Tax=Demequina sp. TaxID=2050685 RepID=UPI003D118796
MPSNKLINVSVARVISIAAIAGAAALIGAAPSLADGESDDNPVCWLNTDDGSFACFDSYADFAEASGVAPTGAARGSASIEPYATYILAVFYEDAAYGGASYNITTSNSSLCSGFHYYGSSMPSGWNDRVSSFDAYGTCRVKIWADAGYSGSTYGPSTGASSMGSMNDQASSYQIYVP